MLASASSNPGSRRATVAVVVARLLIPLWLSVAAVFKIADQSPSHLPAALIKWCGALGLDLRFVLELSIAAELVVAGVMVLVPGLARLTGAAMLGSFVPVLIGDLAMGASTCGCFGAVQMPPWVTLAIDLLFLFVLVVVGRGVPSLAWTNELPAGRVVAAGLWSFASVVVAFAPLPAATRTASGAATIDAAEARPAEDFYLPDYGAWTGQPFRELDLAGWVRGLPDDLDRGRRYVLFYRKDCEHCHELMEVYFTGQLAVPTVAVAVPEKTGFPTVGVQPFVCGECELAELPDGVDWFMQTPVLVRLEDGVVTCAAEVTAAEPTCIDAT